MLRTFVKLIWGADSAQPNTVSNTLPPRRKAPDHPPEGRSVPIYPPTDAGVHYFPATELIASQQELIHRLRLTAGLPAEAYERLYGRVIERLAIAINLLPASETGTHQGAGGLFRLCLEMGFYSLQASEATIFAARAGVERRRLLEPRWRYATWLAGLCAELYRPFTTMVVTTEDGEQWPTYRMLLGEWLEAKDASRYYIRWLDHDPSKPRPGRGAAVTLAQRIIPDESLQYLHEVSNEIAPTMIDVIAGTQHNLDRSPLARIIDSVREKVFARDDALRPQTYGKHTVGQHAEPHLLDAMRRLLKDGTWRINQKKSRLWLGDEGLFLVWTTAAREMLDVLRGDGIAGMPQDAQTLLEMLVHAGVFESHHDGGPYWTIYSPLTEAELVAVKFSNPLTLLASEFEEPASAGLLTVDPKSRSTSTTTTDQEGPANAQHDEQSEPTTETQTVSEPTPQTPTHLGKAESRESSGSGQSARRQPAAEVDLSDRLKPELAKGLDPLTRDVFGALIDDLRGGKIVNQAGRVKEGFAIGLEQIAAYGIDVAAFASAVQKAGWLHTNEEKPNKKILEVQINGKLQRAVVIKMHVAVDIGLIT